MLVRRIRPLPRLWQSTYKRHQQPWRVRVRLSSTASAPPSSTTSANPLTVLTAELDLISPRIDINAEQIEVINGPVEFYEALKNRIHRAKKLIYLSTLYIGKSEHELISAIRHALLHNGPSLRVSILTDALRGTREAPEPSCASLLAPLVAEFPDRVEIRMYHTPNLTGLRKALIPKRINEGWGLQHMKLYGVDDEVILSGANLSNDYFTNRQDRYHIFSSKAITDYFARVHATICSLSFQLESSQQPGGHVLTWPSSNPAPNPLEAPKRYITAATSLLEPLIKPSPLSSQSSISKTSIYPLLVHPKTLNNELPAIRTLFSTPATSYTFTAGYFNPHPAITASLLAASSPPHSTRGTILTASPWANGFYGSSGISGMLPPAYTHLAHKFLRAARGKPIQLREWQRGVVGEKNGWTYHAKGLWVTLPSTSSKLPTHIAEKNGTESEDSEAEAGPNVTLIGSSNYTTRSYGLDLEIGALVVTTDETLRRKWTRETEVLAKYTAPVTEDDLGRPERKASWKVRAAMWIVRAVGGAL